MAPEKENVEQGLVKAPIGTVQVADTANVRALAKDLLDSGLFPAVRNIAGAVTIIQAGLELGIPPVSALNTMAIINGRLAMEAKALLAVAHNRAGVTWEVLEESNKGCRILFHRPGWKDQESSFTEVEAKAASLLSKTNWKLWEKDMYFARAAGRGARRIAPDAVLGMLAKEEAVDVPPGADLDADYVEGPEAKAKSILAQVEQDIKTHAPLKDITDEFGGPPQGADTPPPPGPGPRDEAQDTPAPTPEPTPTTQGPGQKPEAPTMAQFEKFAVIKLDLQGLGIGDALLWDGIRRFATKTLNRKVEELGDLTQPEADMVLGYLSRWKHAIQKENEAREKANAKK